MPRKAPCDNHPDVEAKFELTVYEREHLNVVWRGMVCADCYAGSRAMIKRSGSYYLLLILGVDFGKSTRQVDSGAGAGDVVPQQLAPERGHVSPRAE